MNEYVTLSSRIRQALTELEPVVNRTVQLRDKAIGGDDDYWDAVALNLHGYYTGIEQIFEDIARMVDENMPNGTRWHRDLLLQMSAELNGIRPAVITRESRLCLDDYRGFRHVVRNVYTFRLRPSRMQELVAELQACFTAVSKDLTAFASFLENLPRSAE